MLSLRQPAERRPFLWGLINYLDALSDIEINVNEPTLRLIRLRWWRDHLGQDVGGQPILKALYAYPQHVGQLDALTEAFEEPSVKIDRIFWQLWFESDAMPDQFVDLAAHARRVWTGKGKYKLPIKEEGTAVKSLPNHLKHIGMIMKEPDRGNPHWRRLRLLTGL